MPKEIARQGRAPDIPARRRPYRKGPPGETSHKSYYFNPEDRTRVEYLLEIWGEEDSRLTENGVVRRALELATKFERQRRDR